MTHEHQAIAEIQAIEALWVQDKVEMLDLKNTIKAKNIEKYDLMKDFFLSIIKILDSFEAKDENLQERYAADETAQKVIQSYASIKKQMLNLLAKYGVTKLEFPENRIIVGFSKVVDTEPDALKKNDTIISIVKNGYIRGSELVREAELIIVKN
jgi:molecular chaperone GrpE (heat shock protein)